MRYFLFLICSFLTIGSYSQSVANTPSQYESTWRLKQIIRDKLNRNDNSNPIDYNSIKGSPFLPDNMELGKVSINDSIYGMHLMRYNVYTNEVEIYSDEGVNKQSPSSKIEAEYALLKIDNSEVVFKDLVVKYLPYTDNDNNKSKSYFIEVYKGSKFSLLSKKRCVLTSAQKAASPNHPDRAAKFTLYDDFYIYNHNQDEINVFSLKKKNIKQLFPDNSDELNKFIKEKKVKTKDQGSLITLFTYLNNN